MLKSKNYTHLNKTKPTSVVLNKVFICDIFLNTYKYVVLISIVLLFAIIKYMFAIQLSYTTYKYFTKKKNIYSLVVTIVL